MKDFFDKYGNGSKEPYQALEMIIYRLCEIKEKVERGDSNIMSDLSEASNMLDDFAHQAKSTDFKPREYRNIQGHSQYSPQNHFDVYRTDGRLGYQQTQGHYFPMYPIYPFFNEGRQTDGRDDRRGNRQDGNNYYPYTEQPEAYRRNQSRPNER